MWLVMFWLPVAFVGVILVAGYRDNRVLATTGRRAIGRVLASGCSFDGLVSSYWVKVQYSYDGHPVTASVGVSQRDQERYRVGQPVALTYAPSWPKRLVRLDPPK